jgi:hypothetical protein
MRSRGLLIEPIWAIVTTAIVALLCAALVWR